MLTENKFSKYLIYAFGEIALVVIGILIALQVNNWNENRKLNKIESIMLTDLNEDLILCKMELLNDIKFNAGTVMHYESILNHINNDLPYDSKLDLGFYQLATWESPIFTYTAYEALKNKGIDIIKNQALKRKITYLFESDFAYMVKDYDRAEWAIQTVKLPFITKYIRYYKKGNENFARPIDYVELKKDEQFINLLSKILELRRRGISIYDKTLIKIDEILVDIENELKS